LTWTQIGQTVTIQFSETFLYGFGGTSHKVDRTGLVRFEDVLATKGTQKLKGEQYVYFSAVPILKPSESNFKLIAKASSGLPVEYLSSNEQVISIFNGELIPLKIGVSTITALQMGNENYFAATPVKQDVIVSDYSKLKIINNSKDIYIDSEKKSLHVNWQKISHIRIFNVNGVLIQDFRNQKNTENITIDLSSLSKGAYVLSYVNTNNKLKSFKMFVGQ